MDRGWPAATGQAARVEAAIESGALRRPSAERPSFVDLVRALQRGAGAAVPASPHSDAIARHLFDREHLLLVLVDAMGMTALADPAFADLRNGVRMQLDAVFPATTACAMTTLATGLWPAQHGIPGWWAYLEERDLEVAVLRFRERRSGRSLNRLRVNADDLWPHPPPFAQAAAQQGIVYHYPPDIAGSVFVRYLSGRRRTRAYRRLRQASRRIARNLRRRRRRAPAMTWWYIPHYDSACHEYGVAGAKARELLADIQGLLLELAAAVPDDVRIVLTADHGQFDLERRDRWPLFDGDPVLDCLRAAPTGEGRTPHFHVRPGKERELVERVTDRAGERMAVLSRQEAEDLRLFGPGPLGEPARRRFGDYVGIALAPISVSWHASADAPQLRYVGAHGGMTPDEVRIPLIVLER